VGKKNYRKIPQELLSKIAALRVDDVVVACVKRLEPGDIARYAHLNLRLHNGDLSVPAPAVPPVNMGAFSRTNVDGKEVVRRDLPKIQKSYWVEVPNWGDWSNGSHDVWWTRDVYQRELIPPKELTLSIVLLPRDAGDAHYTVKFQVDQVISRAAPDFDADLLYNLNILQENVGAVDVFASTATIAEYAATIRVDWEILPPGNVDNVLTRMLQGKPPVAAETQAQMKRRLAVMAALNPRNYIAGTNEFLRYFGAQFDDDFVVFENLNYGNALYVMYENWPTLSRRSRVELLKSQRQGFERIPHTGAWENRLKTVLKEHVERKRRRVGA
jgi:hypothetical protein